MTYASKKNYSSSRPSNGGESQSRAKTSGKSENGDTTPTHYIKNSSKEFVQGVFLWENVGEYGPFIKVRVTENLSAGDYYISARKGHLTGIVKG